jgi:hypothetical protein
MSETRERPSRASAETPPNTATFGQHFTNGHEAEIHVVGTGFDPTAKTTVTLAGSFPSGTGTIQVQWSAAISIKVDANRNRVRFKSKPSWSYLPKDRDHGRGIGSLTATVTNGRSTWIAVDNAVAYEEVAPP